MPERALIKFFRNEVFTTGQEKEFIFPKDNAKILSLYIAPEGPNGDPMINIDVQIEINGRFVDLPGATGGTVDIDKLFTFTNEDIHGRLNVKIKAGATPPQNNVDFELWGWSP